MEKHHRKNAGNAPNGQQDAEVVEKHYQEVTSQLKKGIQPMKLHPPGEFDMSKLSHLSDDIKFIH